MNLKTKWCVALEMVRRTERHITPSFLCDLNTPCLSSKNFSVVESTFTFDYRS